jgi:hypothetical protein
MISINHHGLALPEVPFGGRGFGLGSAKPVSEPAAVLVTR